jgi:flagellar biosynthetic protein FlhB
MANDKTEKATPKKREEARRKGQVARSQDLQGSLVMLVGVVVLGATGPATAERLGDVLRRLLLQTSDPSVVSVGGISPLLMDALAACAYAVLPIAGACALTGVLVSVAQVGFKPSPEALKPDLKKLNPMSGFKNIFGPNAAVEAVKSVSKMSIIGAVVFAVLSPKLMSLGASVGMTPSELGAAMAHDIKAIATRAASAFFVLGLADFLWQRHRHEKNLKMDLQEVKDEAKQNDLPQEVKGAIKRRQMSAARQRMMQAVPEADVVVVNPTHYAVALKYDGAKGAPEVVAKGVDLIALRIKELAKEAGVPVVEDVPLARGLHATVEVGEEIPEDLYQAVAAVLAWVYRQKRAA